MGLCDALSRTEEDQLLLEASSKAGFVFLLLPGKVLRVRFRRYKIGR